MAAFSETRKTTGHDPVFTAAWLTAAASAATILGAWYFQYGLGLAPCPLCLEQRWPYYGAIPLALLVAAGARRNVKRGFLIGGLGLIALAMLWGTGLAVYHAGVEWKWWAGPQDCSGAGFSAGSASNLLRQMQTARVVRCDEAPWRLFGLSLAGYNALISLALAALAAFGAVTGLRRYGSSSVSQ